MTAFAQTVIDHAALPPAAAAPAGAPAPAQAETLPRRAWLRDVLLLVLLAGLVALAWQVGELGLVRPQDPLGYWIGVAGASLMGLLFLYPLRKYARWMRRAGRVKAWFWFHLVLGVAGPWLVLVHSGFRAGSINAAVALYSMAVVVASGVVGRFLYVRMNARLDDALGALHVLRRRAGLDAEDDTTSALHYAPAVTALLRAFEARELPARAGRLRALRQVVLLPLQRQIVLRRCLHELRSPLAARADAQHWRRDEWQRRRARAERLIDGFLHAVVRVARQRAFGSVFALWHLAHLPFIFLLVISAVVHIVAVHAY